MNDKQIIDILSARQKGTFIPITFKTEDKPRSQYQGTRLTKVTEGVFRFGISYGNIGSVREAIDSGERKEVGSRPWGKWVPGYENVLLEHNGVKYLRIYTAPNKTTTRYFVNGLPVPKESYAHYLTGSKASKLGEEKLLFVKKTSDIISIGK